VALELQQLGFNARPLAGGFAAWRDGGMPLAEGEAAPQRAMSNM
jgi:rhodanese-related sulfurtransferase